MRIRGVRSTWNPPALGGKPRRGTASPSRGYGAAVQGREEPQAQSPAGSPGRGLSTPDAHGSVRIGYPHVKEDSRSNTPERDAHTPMAEARLELLKIGDFAKLAGTNLRTLRYYEELDLLIPASRSQGGFRYYRRTDLHRLNMIHDLQALGLPLEQIRDLMATRGNGGARKDFLAKVRAALGEQDRLLAKRIAELEGQRTNIAAAVTKLANCETCKHSPQNDNNYCEPCQLTGERLPETLSALF
jgi:DNA-binding transcriptional MerR regulator